MLNMIDLTEYDVLDDITLYGLHIVYVFMIAILLLNFLIALLSTAAAEVALNRYAIMVVQRLSVLCLIERRFSWALYWLYKPISKRLFTCKDGRIYIVGVRSNIERVQSEKWKQSGNEQDAWTFSITVNGPHIRASLTSFPKLPVVLLWSGTSFLLPVHLSMRVIYTYIYISYGSRTWLKDSERGGSCEALFALEYKGYSPQFELGYTVDN